MTLKGGPLFVLPSGFRLPVSPPFFGKGIQTLAGLARDGRVSAGIGAFQSALRLLKRYPTVLLGYSTISSPALSSFKRAIPTKKIGIGENFSLPGSIGQSFPALFLGFPLFFSPLLSRFSALSPLSPLSLSLVFLSFSLFALTLLLFFSYFLLLALICSYLLCFFLTEQRECDIMKNIPRSFAEVRHDRRTGN